MKSFALKKQNEEFIQKIKEHNPDYFDELQKGQTPEYFLLSCSDSRVSPSIIMQMPLGHMFVHRNIANQVVAEDESFSASLFYAIKHLNVKKLVVKGHTGCGGVKAAWEGNEDPELQKWLGHIRGSLPENRGEAEPSLNELAKLNVLSQVEKLLKHPVYQQLGEGVEVSGCIFHVETGELEQIYPL
ncbi:carbonic anhydrase [Planococcus sp. ISL-110]|uniref:carbonic anhydrase n=1 Tax=Planococcus sp. ISL-110 TaxID=2819167 RepID=UPI001BEC9D25|nr:carbonic anhydrase [Planococcus sp. ISL-110]MBT2570791.1 carbonate dehydratase [Planococcus sp. ISL-110]